MNLGKNWKTREGSAFSQKVTFALASTSWRATSRCPSLHAIHRGERPLLLLASMLAWALSNARTDSWNDSHEILHLRRISIKRPLSWWAFHDLKETGGNLMIFIPKIQPKTTPDSLFVVVGSHFRYLLPNLQVVFVAPCKKEIADSFLGKPPTSIWGFVVPQKGFIWNYWSPNRNFDQHPMPNDQPTNPPMTKFLHCHVVMQSKEGIDLRRFSEYFWDSQLGGLMTFWPFPQKVDESCISNFFL